MVNKQLKYTYYTTSFFYIVISNVATNFLQYKINEAFAIIKQTTISEPYTL